MSDGLRTIAARYAAGRWALDLVASVDDECRSHVLRCVMRYGLIWNAVRCEMGCCKLEGGDWEGRLAELPDYYHSHFGNALTSEWSNIANTVVPYIRYNMRWLFLELKTALRGVRPMVLEEEELSKVVRWFLALPDRERYGYKG